jgi:hypothetical protein
VFSGPTKVSDKEGEHEKEVNRRRNEKEIR